MIEFGGKKLNMHREANPNAVLDAIQLIVLKQQSEFDRIWAHISTEMQQEHIHLLDEQHLDEQQQEYVKKYFMIKCVPTLFAAYRRFARAALPAREEHLLGVVMSNTFAGVCAKICLDRSAIESAGPLCYIAR